MSLTPVAAWWPSPCVHTHPPCCVPGYAAGTGGAAFTLFPWHPGERFHPLNSSTPGTERVTRRDALSRTGGHTALATIEAGCEVVHRPGLLPAHCQGSEPSCAPLVHVLWHGPTGDIGVPSFGYQGPAVVCVCASIRLCG